MKIANNQVMLTIGEKSYSTGFIEQALEYALKNGLTDKREEHSKAGFVLSIQTPVGLITSRPIVETDQYLGFWTDWIVDGEFIALSTSEYQVDEKVFVTHEYADFSEDSPTRSATHHFDKTTNAESVLLRLKQSPDDAIQIQE